MDTSAAQLATNAATHAATHLLLIESDPIDATLIQDALVNKDGLFVIVWVTSLTAALEYVAKNPIDVILVDLMLPEARGLDAFDHVLAAAPNTLIFVLSTGADDDLMQETLKRGAQDYVLKRHLDTRWLLRGLHYVLERNDSRQALRDSEARFRIMIDASPLGILLADEQGNCIYTNAAYQRISGQTVEETLGLEWASALHPEDRAHTISHWQNAVQNQHSFLTEVRFLHKDNTQVWARLNAAVIRQADTQKAQGFVEIVENISDRKTMETHLRVSEEALFEQQERAQVTLNSIGDAVLTTNLAGQVNYLNPVAESMTGWSMQEALGLSLEKVFTVIDADTRQTPANPVKRALKTNKTVKLPRNCLLIRRDGSESPIEDSIAPIHNRKSEVTGAVIVFHDVSESRAVAKKIMHMAQHDVLTGLANRSLLTERLTRALGLAKRKKKIIALLFIDIDNFKQINDSRGHAVGDRLLQSIAQRLESVVRGTDTVCRQGGDEFVVLLTEIEHSQDAAHVAEKMIASFATPHIIHEQSIFVTLSIGISLYPNDGADVDALFHSADAAMYRAKICGRNNYQFYSGGCEMKVDTEKRDNNNALPQANTRS